MQEKLSALKRKADRLCRMVSRWPKLKPYRKKENIRVGFLVQLPSLWDKQVDLYNELKKRPGVETFIFAAPACNCEFENYREHEISAYFKEHYPDVVDICKAQDVEAEFLKYQIDYLFYPRPYDHYLPDELKSENLHRHVSCCYIPYGLSGSPVFNGVNIENKFFDNISVLYMDSPYQCELMKKRYFISSRIGLKKVRYLGYPVLNQYVQYPHIDNGDCITWTPRWSNDAVIGGSCFLDYAEHFLELVRKMNCSFIFRPHPLMFDELVSKGAITEEYRDYYLAELAKYHVNYDITSPIDVLFEKTTILISDFSGILPQFFFTGRPIIYCEKGIPLNRTYGEMMDLNYRTDNWADVEKTVELLLDGRDDKAEKRAEYIRTSETIACDPAARIADDLIYNRKPC